MNSTTLPQLISQASHVALESDCPEELVVRIAELLARKLGDVRVSIALRPGHQSSAGVLSAKPARLSYSRPIAVRGVVYGQLQVDFLGQAPAAHPAVLLKALEAISLQTGLAAERFSIEGKRQALEFELATEKVVARASGILARSRRIPLYAAKQWLQSEAVRTGKTLYWLADMLIAGSQFLRPANHPGSPVAHNGRKREQAA